MPLQKQRGGKRPGAGRKPRIVHTALEAIKGSDPGQEPDDGPKVATPDPAGQNPGTVLEGWALITYLDRYLTGKQPRALAALAKQQNGVMVVNRLATFFHEAASAADQRIAPQPVPKPTKAGRA